MSIDVHALRVEAGLSQMQAARLCQVDTSTISRWERGIQPHTYPSRSRRLHVALQRLLWVAEAKRENPALNFDELQAHVRRQQAQQLKRAGRAG